MTKGLAVNYVVMIIIGIVVLAVIGFWFFTTAGGGGGRENTFNCDAMKLAFCQEWASYGYSSEPVFNKWDATRCPGKSENDDGLRNFCQNLLQNP